MEQIFDVDEDNVPRNVKVYKQKEYWDYRFSKEQEYDWIANMNKLDEKSPGLIQEIVQILNGGSVLNLGCGNSTLHNVLFERGVTEITNCDYSTTLIEKMQKEQPSFKWIEADITKLKESFQEKQFANIVEKCTIDALVVDVKDPWNPEDQIRNQIQSVFEGVHFCLQDGGYFISFSFDQPHFRKKYFDQLTHMFKIELRRKIEIGFKECFVYFMQKI